MEYDRESNVIVQTDAESKTTEYEYNSRGHKDKETFPGHNPTASPGDGDFEVAQFAFDEAGRLKSKTDQNGDTVTFNYDLASRMYQRDYRTKANSPSGTIAYSNVDTYDKASRMLTAESGQFSNKVTHVFDDFGRLALNYDPKGVQSRFSGV